LAYTDCINDGSEPSIEEPVEKEQVEAESSRTMTEKEEESDEEKLEDPALFKQGIGELLKSRLGLTEENISKLSDELEMLFK